jgi:two-component system, cell cycle sensor histidine kinase and response regulator CckA
MADSNISASPSGGQDKTEAKTILVVDDEDKLREILKLGLTRHGFSVLEAASGEDALQLSKDYLGPIHLLLVDVVMPGMSGVELAPQLLASRPNTKVILMSGYRDDQILLNAALNPNTPFFHKPFTIDSLIQTIDNLLQDLR